MPPRHALSVQVRALLASVPGVKKVNTSPHDGRLRTWVEMRDTEDVAAIQSMIMARDILRREYPQARVTNTDCVVAVWWPGEE